MSVGVPPVGHSRPVDGLEAPTPKAHSPKAREASRLGGIVQPSALAVFKLTIRLAARQHPRHSKTKQHKAQRV